MVGEDIFSDGDEYRAAKELKGEDNGHPRGDIFEGKRRLSRNTGLLEAEAETEAKEDLIPDPPPLWDPDVEGIDQANADGHEDHGSPDKWHIISDSCCHRTSEYHTKDLRYDQR